jgi:methionyl-tRNA synthetase
MHAFAPLYVPFGTNLLAPLLVVAAIWTVILKGFSLWYAARGHQKWWFIAMLVVNTLGILEIVYLIWFRPKSDIVSSPVAPSSPAQ